MKLTDTAPTERGTSLSGMVWVARAAPVGSPAAAALTVTVIPAVALPPSLRNTVIEVNGPLRPAVMDWPRPCEEWSQLYES